MRLTGTPPASLISRMPSHEVRHAPGFAASTAWLKTSWVILTRLPLFNHFYNVLCQLINLCSHSTHSPLFLSDSLALIYQLYLRQKAAHSHSHKVNGIFPFKICSNLISGLTSCTRVSAVVQHSKIFAKNLKMIEQVVIKHRQAHNPYRLIKKTNNK